MDGATSEHDKKSNIGFIIRDSKGQLIAALSKLLQAQYPTELVEVMAMDQGVFLAQEMHLTHVIFEANALSVIQAINNTTGNDFGHIIQEIQQARNTFARRFF